ncbi:MAG: N-acetylmuramoyl-L-alanine amidase [Jatrophihabitantaceae bacterium]
MRRLCLLLTAGACLLAGCGTAGPGAQPATTHARTGIVVTVVSPSTARPAVPTPLPTTHLPPPGLTTTTGAPAPAPTTARRAPPPSVRGLLVVLDPGHNGGNASHAAEIDRLVPAGFGQSKACNTTGTDTNAGYPEHAFTFDVALRVRAILVAHGVRVIMTRTDDSGVGPCVNVRAAIESTPGVRAAVAIHADGAPSAGHGFHVCYASRRPEGASTATMAGSLSLSTAVHDSLTAGSGLVPSTYIGANGYFPRSDLAGLNLSTVPTTFLELGNMRNASDAALQSSAAGRARIALAIATGILAYLAR